MDYLSFFTVVLRARVFVIQRKWSAYDALAAQAGISDRAVVSAIVTGNAIGDRRVTACDIPFVIAGTDVLGTDIIVKTTQGRSRAEFADLWAILIFFCAGLTKIFLRTAISVVACSAIVRKGAGYSAF